MKNVVILLLCAFLVAGCGEMQGLANIQVAELGNNTAFTQRTITIEGMGEYREIEEELPMRLSVSGQKNEIRVNEGTVITSITISGKDNIISLPAGSEPEIIDEGEGTIITYY